MPIERNLASLLKLYTKYSRLCIDLDKEDDTAKSIPIK